MKPISFRTYISVVFILLFSMFSLATIVAGVSHLESEEALFSTENVKNFTRTLKVTIKQVSNPVVTLLDTQILSDLINSDRQDFQWLAAITTTLNKNPFITSLYSANEQGQSVYIYRVSTQMRSSYPDMPDNAAFSLSFNDINGPQQRITLSNTLQVISSVTYASDHYDPRTRAWFKNTRDDDKIFISDPYRFYPSGRLGFTFSRRTLDGNSVLAADFDSQSLTALLQHMQYSKNSLTYLLTATKEVIASNRVLNSFATSGTFNLTELDLNRVLDNMGDFPVGVTTLQSVTLNKVLSRVMITPLDIGNGHKVYLINSLKEEEFLAKSSFLNSHFNMKNMLFLTLFFFIVSILSTGRIAKPLIYLNKSLINIQRFEYRRKEYKVSNIVEIDQLNDTMMLMESVLTDFFNNLYNVARSSKPEELSASIVDQTSTILSANSCQLFINNRVNREVFHLTANSSSLPEFDLPQLLQSNQAVLDEHVYVLSATDADIIFATGPCKRGFIIPLMNRKEQNVGALVIGFNGEISSCTHNRISLVRNFIGFNEIVLEHLEKEHEQQALFHSFVKMTAAALDKKSPYTGGHCQRVPKITELIANAADVDTDTFSNFSLTSKNKEELLVAAWLHDCGKVTTPDYVMDKATKLETVYDRIHEIRMRYEVLKRDADIVYWQSIVEGGDTADSLARCNALKDELNNEFAFVASCNTGYEFLVPEKIKRLADISLRTWTRTLPDDIGISQQALVKKAGRHASLPAVERVLADNVEHLSEWEAEPTQSVQSKRHFKMAKPAYQFNRGELHNLGVQAGTLTAEERYNINDHIVQTYLMLDQIVYPEHLKNVPLIAGSHHEKMNGQGYPLKLKDEEIPIGGRMIAVADIFEALTASDRPYKEAKKLSEALKIMAFMVKDEHLDEAVFDLFLTHGIYQKYAAEYLKAEQLDAVDVVVLRAIYQKV
jgi:HD-GYP domain-containing protein (c-di-GMP phosphodiesterase class II)